MEYCCVFLLILVLTNVSFGTKWPQNSNRKRLLQNDPGVMMNLINQKQVKIQTLEATVNQMKQSKLFFFTNKFPNSKLFT